ncbi:MAG: tetrahydromethanopterin S-methyltransferase subunit MtrC [Candidatus Bathyarchaeota archaeon]
MSHAHTTTETLKRVSVPPKHLAIIGLISGIIGVYGSSIHPVIAAVLVIPPALWGADAVRRIASYGLGTGVPSIGNLVTSMGILAALVGLKFQPIYGVVIAGIAGLVYGILISRFKILEIPNFTKYILELALGSSLILMCLLCAAVGGYTFTAEFFNEKVMPNLLYTGFIIVIFWGSSFTVFHPFNAGLGGGERQARTLRIGVVVTGLNITLVGIIALAITTPLQAIPVIVAGVVVWIYGLYNFLHVCMREAASTVWTGIPPKVKRK